MGSNPLLILCVDGLDPTLWSELGFSLPYERKLSIPRELYHGDPPSPFTLHVWPTIFAGRVEIHSFREEGSSVFRRARLRVRRFLHDHGAKWQRESTIKPKLYLREAEDLLFDHYSSFTWNLPTVDPSFLFPSFGASDKRNFEYFKQLAVLLESAPFEVVALYTIYLDHLGHRVIGEKGLDILQQKYEEVYKLTQLLRGPYVLLSDHGCVVDHTDEAYFGSTGPIYANSVLEVRADLERILDG